MFSLIIPVYRNEDTIEALIEALERLARQLPESFEAVFVVDGSPDRSFELLTEKLTTVSFARQLFLLSRNFGSFLAIRLGLEKATGPYFAVMSADLQEPIELMAQFHEALASSDHDVALGVRISRHDPFWTRIAANCFWAVYRRFVQPEMPPGGVDVFACNQQVRDALLKMEESHTSLIGQLIWLGFRRVSIPYIRQPRLKGKSAWTFRKKLNYMLNSIFSFSSLPITLLRLIGLLGLTIGLLAAVIVVFGGLAGWLPIPGPTSLLLLILLASSANLVGLSLAGLYAWRAYENSKRRPHTVILREIGFPKTSEKE